MTDEALSKLVKYGHNVLLLGAAGTGKSFLTKKVIKDLKSDGKTVALTCSIGIACHVYEPILKLYITKLKRELPESSSSDVTLFAKNEFVDDYNRKCIVTMPGPLSVFKAEDTGDTARLNKLIVPKVLWLKVGIPVLLLRNINDKLVNGLKGSVLQIDGNGPLFQFPDVDGECIRLEKQVFSPRLQTNVATRTQYPVKPSFGMTIHKAQGMTLERITVDCRDIFQAGQLGVALSRVKSASGLRVVNFHPRVCVKQPEIVTRFIEEDSIQPDENLNCCTTQIQRKILHLLQETNIHIHPSNSIEQNYI